MLMLILDPGSACLACFTHHLSPPPSRPLALASQAIQAQHSTHFTSRLAPCCSLPPLSVLGPPLDHLHMTCWHLLPRAASNRALPQPLRLTPCMPTATMNPPTKSETPSAHTLLLSPTAAQPLLAAIHIQYKKKFQMHRLSCPLSAL